MQFVYTRAMLALSMVAFALTACESAETLSAPRQIPGSAAQQTAIAAAPAPDQATANYEIKFMEGMIDHHMMAIMMARLCVQKATHEELRQLCENVIAAQSAEIEQMQRWLRNWYGITYEPQMTRSGRRQLDELASLSGAEFEIRFMQMLIEHHQTAVKKAQACVRRAYHRQLRDLCEDIIAAQSAEIQQLQTWLCTWYGICR